MSSSASNPDSGGSRPFAEPPATPPSDRVDHRNLLDRVLQETLAAANPEGPLSQAELGALVDVARRHGTDTLSLDAVTELVETVLQNRVKSLADSERSLATMAREIAGTLRDDQQTWERIEAFWGRLCEAAK